MRSCGCSSASKKPHEPGTSGRMVFEHTAIQPDKGSQFEERQRGRGDNLSGSPPHRQLEPASIGPCDVERLARVGDGLIVHLLPRSIVDLLARALVDAEHHDDPAPGPAQMAREADAPEVEDVALTGGE